MPSWTGSLGVAAPLLLGPQLVVAEHLLGLARSPPRSCRSRTPARHGGERELLVLDPVLLADLERVDPDLGGQLVHDPLDGVRRLRPAGAAVGVGPGLVGEHRLHVELVGRELVDRVVHERAEHRHAAADERDVGAQVGEQLDLEAGDRAVLLGGEGQLLPLVAAVVGRRSATRSGSRCTSPACRAGGPPRRRCTPRASSGACRRSRRRRRGRSPGSSTRGRRSSRRARTAGCAGSGWPTTPSSARRSGRRPRSAAP